MTGFDDWPAWVAFLTIISAYAMGYFMSRMDSTPPPRSFADPRLAYTRAELHGFTCGMFAALIAIHSKTDPPSRSSPVSGAGLPVAGAGGETG
jgi:hypothetical protein